MHQYTKQELYTYHDFSNVYIFFKMQYYSKYVCAQKGKHNDSETCMSNIQCMY